ncbi:hypothetical protein EUTSA_v10028071mg [Eutrema salsugineum]|uniref:C2 domain-containing protein n=1 Tax=Eutrema salsugineum TaxID=72664 RepID=V4M4D6_EUTSA|nr:hypothetical protein EUTSA_v10028071mg [Eutrema salsugineum]
MMTMLKRQRLIREGKRVQEIVPENIELILKFSKGFIIDEEDPTQPYEYFKVMVWTDAEDQYERQVVKSFRGFHWFNDKQYIVIPLDFPEDQYLYIEFQRINSWQDPGTSKGITVLGRAKIPLPPRTSDRLITCKAGLVGLNSDRCVVFKGHLDISMKLHRYVDAEYLSD